MQKGSIKIIDAQKDLQENVNLQRTSWAVNRFLGSLTSILLTRSFALSDILGHGSDTKSSSPFKTCSNIPCSVSDSNNITAKEM